MSKYKWNNNPCVKDAVLYPEVGTLKEIGAQVGDVVRFTDSQFDRVILSSNGVGINEYTIGIVGYEGNITGQSANAGPVRIIYRANQDQPSPVRTVTTTRQEIVPGVYGKVHVHACGDFTIDQCTHDGLTAAIETLIVIRDAMRSNAAS